MSIGRTLPSDRTPAYDCLDSEIEAWRPSSTLRQATAPLPYRRLFEAAWTLRPPKSGVWRPSSTLRQATGPLHVTADEFKSNTPLEPFLIGHGVSLFGGGGSKHTNRCAKVEHKKGHYPVNVDTAKGVWYCNDCKIGGSVIDWIMMSEGKTLNQVIGNGNGAPAPVDPPISAQIVGTYDYYDELGRFVYQVCRLEPKSFRQRRKDGEKWVWNMEGVTRVLYNLPQVLNPKNKWVWVVEGEKDALTLMKLGLVATTNVGGAGKWAESYSDALKGKDVVLCGDNDVPGQVHMKKVMESLAEKAASIRQVSIPEPHKDVTEFVDSFTKQDDAYAALVELMQSAAVLTGGIELPIQSMEELEADYVEHLKLAKLRVLNLSNWLPTLGRKCRGLVPGDVAVFLAATGVGKTALLQNLAKSAAPLPTLMFELELSGEQTFERFGAMSEGMTCRQVEDEYAAGRRINWRERGKLSHIWACTKSYINPEKLETFINKSELKIGVRPVLVLIDYIQLMGGHGNKRYEVVSDAAESIKRIAKATKTIIVIASQLRRKEEGDGEVHLNDAKESGSIENSAGLVIGAWRTDLSTMRLKILKNSKGFTDKEGEELICNFDGATMTITELAPEFKIDKEDVPRPYKD